MSHERRQFSRINFVTPARLQWSDDSQQVQLLDISLKGVLVRSKPVLHLAIGTPVAVHLPLDDEDASIRMEGTVVHNERGEIGMVCREIDIDSITHLKRLVELNLGDPEMLEREWHHLVAE